MKFKGLFLAVILATGLYLNENLLAYSGGDGEPNNPYQITDLNDFLQLTTDPNNWDKSFILTADIDLISLTFNKAPIAPDTNDPNDPNTEDPDYIWIFQGIQFVGTFDGNGHKISNLTILASIHKHIGLFGLVGPSGQIRNLSLTDLSVNGDGYIGGLVGLNTGSLINCHATGVINGIGQGSFVGGLVALNVGPLINCNATIKVHGAGIRVGGLVGQNSSATLSKCYATGSVSGTRQDSYVGGLVGSNSGTIASCYATGTVIGGFGVGGLVGCNWCGSLSTSYTTCSVNGIGDIGGIIGYNYRGSATACYATGSVRGTGQDSFVGGLIGGVYGDDSLITYCYATGYVDGAGQNSRVGGLIGENSGTPTSCFWDIQSSGKTDGIGIGTSKGVLGKTTAEMKTLSTFISAEWDFAEIWGIGNGQTYPYLKPVTGINPADMNYSGTVNMQDLAILATNWLAGI